MVGWHQKPNGHGFEQTLRGSEGQGSLACCSLWGHKELDTTERLNNNRTENSTNIYMINFIVDSGRTELGYRVPGILICVCWQCLSIMLELQHNCQMNRLCSPIDLSLLILDLLPISYLTLDQFLTFLRSVSVSVCQGFLGGQKVRW